MAVFAIGCHDAPERRSYLKGQLIMSKVYNIRDISSIRDMVETSCELFADNPAFLSRDGETVYVKTYTEVGEDIRALF